jgi:hypothetical protein
MENRIPQNVQADTRKAIAALREEVDKEWAYGRRKEYLITVMRPIVERCLFLYARYELCVEQNNIVAMTLVRERLTGEVRKVVKMQNELYFSKPERKKPASGVTPEMIQRAKEYPYTDLLELRRGMARCPFHDDRNPSFSVKNNYGRCFSGSCGWHGDAIAFVMERDGIPFREAVMVLQ